MANVFQCPSGCADVVLEATNFSECAPAVNSSEIEKIFIAPGNAPDFEDEASPTEWLARVSQTAKEENTIRVLTVIADKPASQSTPIELSNGRTKIVKKTNTVNFTIDDTSTENYNFARTLECGGNFKIWYQTQGGFLYGGKKGIKIKSVTIDPINERGRDSIETITGTLSWESKTSFVERVKSPIADENFDPNNGITPPIGE